MAVNNEETFNGASALCAKCKVREQKIKGLEGIIAKQEKSLVECRREVSKLYEIIGRNALRAGGFCVKPVEHETGLDADNAFANVDCDLKVKTEPPDYAEENSQDLYNMMSQSLNSAQSNADGEGTVDAASRDCNSDGDGAIIAARTLQGKREYVCAVIGCGKIFADRRVYRRHVSTHEDTKRFECDFPGCDRGFNRKTHLKTHSYSHTGQRPFRCSYSGCGKGFVDNWTRKQHELTHTCGRDRDFVCPFEGCAQAYSARSSLRRHVVSHANLRPFKCTYDGCGREYMRSESLKKHSKKHGDKKWFVCTVGGCGKRYVNKNRVDQHIRTHKAQVREINAERHL